MPRLRPEAIFKYFRQTFLRDTWYVVSSLCIHLISDWCAKTIPSSNRRTETTALLGLRLWFTHFIFFFPHAFYYTPSQCFSLAPRNLAGRPAIFQTPAPSPPFTAQTCSQTTGHKMAVFHLGTELPTVSPLLCIPPLLRGGHRGPGTWIRPSWTNGPRNWSDIDSMWQAERAERVAGDYRRSVKGLFFVCAARSRFRCAVTHTWHINIFS